MTRRSTPVLPTTTSCGRRRSPAKGWLALTLLAALCGLLATPVRGEEAPKVILIGLDGGSWNVLEPLLREGSLPHLEKLVRRGTGADLRSVRPLISPAVWTSVATGQSPEVHGIKNFFHTAEQIQVPTIWRRLADRGRRVGLYDYLLTWPPADLPGGFVVPGWLRRDGSLSPPDAFSRLELEPYQFNLLIDRPESALETMEGEVRDKAWRFNRLVEAFSIELGAVSFYSNDVISHQFWHTLEPESFDNPPPVDPRYENIIPRTLQGLDGAIGEITDALGPLDTVVIVSDHGFVARHRVERRYTFRDKLLELGKIDPKRDGIQVLSQWQNFLVRIDPGPEKEREAQLQHLVKFFSSLRDEAGTRLFFVDTVHVPPRPSESAYRKVQELTTLLETDTSAYAFLRAQPDRHVWNTRWNDGAVDIAGRTVPLRDLAQPENSSGRHAPVGIFLAAGPGIQHLSKRPTLTILDVAPLLFYLLGEPIPDDLAGRLPVELLHPDFLERNPPQTSSSEIELPQEGETPETLPIEDAELLKRLRTLGYIE